MIEELFSILVLNDHFKLSPFIITSDLNLKMWCAKSELKILCFACFLKDLFCPDFFGYAYPIEAITLDFCTSILTKPNGLVVKL